MNDGSVVKKKPFLNRLVIFFVAIFAFIAMISMLLCAVNPLVDPNFFVWTSFFGLAFWPILLANILLFVILILLKARKSLYISLLALVLTVPGFMRSYSVGKEKIDEGNLKIMTYNVGAFFDVDDSKRTRVLVKNDVIQLINNEKPDIVCLQESGRWTKETADDFGEKIGCKYYSTNTYDHRGNIIFSKFPLEDDDFTKAFNASGAAGFAKIVKAKSRGVFYLENSHLQSNNISRDEIEYVGDTKNYVEKSSTGKSIVRKLKEGFELRTSNTKAIVENLPQNHIPIIICGDFNDTPLSYTYQRMKKAGFEDAFLSAGHGVGTTYCGKLPMLRIDYFWHGENIVPFTFKVVRKQISDHYPIVMTFNVSH